MPLFYERAVKRKISPTVLASPFFGSQPHNLPLSSSTRAGSSSHFSHPSPTVLEILWSDPRSDLPRREAPTIVLSETSTQLESSPTAISGRAGGHTAYASSLGAALLRLATHVTQRHLILPPNLFESLPAREVAFLWAAGWCLSSLKLLYSGSSPYRSSLRSSTPPAPSPRVCVLRQVSPSPRAFPSSAASHSTPGTLRSGRHASPHS